MQSKITALLDKMTEGWRLGSGAVFAEPFSESVRFVAFDGSVLNGPEQIAAFHQRAFDTVLKGTLLELKVDEMKQVDRSIWLVFARGWHESNGGLGGGKKAMSVNMFICDVNDRAAKVLAFQNTRSRPIADQASADAWKAFDASWENIDKEGSDS